MPPKNGNQSLRCEIKGGEPNRESSQCSSIDVELKGKDGQILASFKAYVPQRQVSCMPYWCELKTTAQINN